MVKLLGQGTFGKVVQAKDRHRNKLVAIKIIRSVQKYRDASKIELRVLATLKVNDEQNRNRCIHLRDCFDYRGHICIVMDLLGQSVFDFLKSNNFVPFPNSQIQNFARQLLTSVACTWHHPASRGIGACMLTSHSPSRPQPDPHRSQAREHPSLPQRVSDIYVQPQGAFVVADDQPSSDAKEGPS